MPKTIRKFIDDLRDAPLEVRRRWVVVLSAATMTVVVGLWVVYINAVVQPIEKIEAAEKSVSPGLARILGAGASVVWEGITDRAGKFMASVKNIIGSARRITVSSNEQNFIVEDLETVKPTTLP